MASGGPVGQRHRLGPRDPDEARSQLIVGRRFLGWAESMKHIDREEDIRRQGDGHGGESDYALVAAFAH